MSTHLVVAHQTAASPELITVLKTIARDDVGAEFVLLVPATPPRHLLTWVEGESDAVARARTEEATRALRAAGLTVRAAVIGPADPLEAIGQQMSGPYAPFKQAIVCTLPQGLSRWLGSDLPSKVRKQFGIHVLHVVAGPPWKEVARSANPGPSTGTLATGDWPANDPPLSLEESAHWQGEQLSCVDGDVGRINGVLYDYMTRASEWLCVASHPLPFRTLLAPAGTARVIENHLVVPYKKEFIESQPPIDIGEGFSSLTDEEHIYRYFGIPFTEIHDIRVLRPGQELPGSEVNWQNIFDESTASR
jgi:hypothetical protein